MHQKYDAVKSHPTPHTGIQEGMKIAIAMKCLGQILTQITSSVIASKSHENPKGQDLWVLEWGRRGHAAFK